MVRTLVRPLLVLILVLFGFSALSHDSWINRGGYKNAGGEWCCGEGDCFVVHPGDVKATPVGYQLINGEVIPYRETLPSQPDHKGAINYVRCMRPDGSRRCFFAPQPAM
jgi:hypothetical protein